MDDTGDDTGDDTVTDDRQWFADHFAEQRPRLRAVAYRMLGSMSEAEDALQEAWIRSIRSDSTSINNINGWLTTVVGRVCIDILRARQAHPETPAGTSLPEPLVSAHGERADPETAALLADSVGLALLVVLDTLDPAERLAFVLHDMFGVPFDEIAPIVDRTPAAARQLASRARRRVRGTSSVPDADLATQHRVATAFLEAARAGDFEGLIKVLHPDVVFRVDTGPRTWLAPALLVGADAVAEHAAAHGPRFATLCHPAVVNGAAGIVAKTRGGIIAVVGITVVQERIVEIDLILDSDKLTRATFGE
ncbi:MULTISPECIES: sigma-70 family RNA polymerase sigma factor [Kribbella]|uniref:RNA polymerase sigma factor SigJ n=1 Tax=Kribbella karoonensis TaxID=324851 RepID=A0ABP4PHB2_9ACTN